MSLGEKPKVYGFGKGIDSKPSCNAFIVDCEGYYTSGETEAIGSYRVAAKAIAVLTDAGGEDTQQKWSDEAIFIGIGGNAPFIIDCEILIRFAFGTGKCAISPLQPYPFAFYRIPFCVPVKRRYRWFGIAAALTCLAQLVLIFIYRKTTLPHLAHMAHSPFGIIVVVFQMSGIYIWLGFSFLAACLLFELAKRQHQLALANQALLDLQAQIKESARIEERLRLSRELHDAAGHYLTSLSIQLEIAQHRAAEAVLPPIARAQLITRVLLAEIRESVSAWREDETRELSHALKRLLRDATGVQTHLETQGDLTHVPASISHGLYRCAQEAVTNVLRHSEAKNLWIQLARQDAAIRLTVKDDGGGCGGFTEGNGLRGMQSRVEEMHGTLEVESRSDGGFAVDIGVPIKEEQTT